MTTATGCSIWLCGSYARGDQDRDSDIDLAVLGDRQLLPTVPPNVLVSEQATSPTYYTWAEVAKLISYGSPFFHHLRLEGRELAKVGSGAAWLDERLSTIPRYQRLPWALRSFNLTLDDVDANLNDDSPLAFELSVVAALLRHAAVAALCAWGTPSFGRLKAFEQLAKTLGLRPQSVSQFEALYRFKMFEERGLTVDVGVRMADVVASVEFARQVLDAIEEYDNEVN